MVSISDEEKLRRRLSNQGALGTLAMEGLVPDESTQALLRDYEEGILTLDEFSRAMDLHAHILLANSGKLAGAA